MKFQQYQFLKKNLFPFDEQNVLNDRYKNEDISPKLLNPLVLAYIGDACYHLYVRTRLLNFEQSHVHLLNDFSMQIVSATFQVQAYEAVKDELTETENYIFKRGRNAKSHAPRVASVHDYHISTGFEAVLGYLYLNKEQERLDFLCEKAFVQVAKNMYQAHRR